MTELHWPAGFVAQHTLPQILALLAAEDAGDGKIRSEVEFLEFRAAQKRQREKEEELWRSS